MERDQWACRSCGSTEKTLHVHHKYYDRDLEPWEYDNQSLITLCHECHVDADSLRCEIVREIGMLELPLIARILDLLRVASSSKADMYLIGSYAIRQILIQDSEKGT